MSHANAALTPRARLRLARLIVDQAGRSPGPRSGTTCPGRPRSSGPTRYRQLGAGRDGRPVLAPAPQPEPDPGRRWSARSCTCAGSSGWARSQIGDRARHAGLDRARGAGPVPAQPAVPRRPGHRRADPPLRARAPRRRCSTWTSRSSATSPTAAAGATSAASRATGTGPPPRASPRNAAPQPDDRAPRTCTPSSTTTPGSPTPRSTTTRPPPPPPPCCAAPWPGSPTAASPSSGCCPTTASAYRSHLWRDTCAELGITPKRTRPYRPQTNGKIERFHRTLAGTARSPRAACRRRVRHDAPPARWSPTQPSRLLPALRGQRHEHQRDAGEHRGHEPSRRRASGQKACSSKGERRQRQEDHRRVHDDRVGGQSEDGLGHGSSGSGRRRRRF